MIWVVELDKGNCVGGEGARKRERKPSEGKNLTILKIEKKFLVILRKLFIYLFYLADFHLKRVLYSCSHLFPCHLHATCLHLACPSNAFYMPLACLSHAFYILAPCMPLECLLNAPCMPFVCLLRVHCMSNGYPLQACL